VRDKGGGIACKLVPWFDFCLCFEPDVKIGLLKKNARWWRRGKGGKMSFTSLVPSSSSSSSSAASSVSATTARASAICSRRSSRGELPTREKQKEEVFDLKERYEHELELGEKYYVVSSSWWKSWLEHVEQGGPSPEEIDNSDVVDESGIALKDEGVSEGSSYVLRHERIWDLLFEWYGATHAVSGEVRQNRKGKMFVDIRPIIFEVYEIGPEPGVVSKVTDESLVLSRSLKLSELPERVSEFISGVKEEMNDANVDIRVWVAEGSTESFSLVRDASYDDEIRDVFTGLAKWKIVLERKSVDVADWLCGDGNDEIKKGQEFTRNEDDGMEDKEVMRKLRQRASSFVREHPQVGQCIDVKRRKDGKWHEAVITDVQETDEGYQIRVHFLSFEKKEDELFDASDEDSIAPAYTRVPDWRTQLRKDEEVEVHRRAVNSSALSLNGTWLTGKVRGFDRNAGALYGRQSPKADDESAMDVTGDSDGAGSGTSSPSAHASSTAQVAKPRRKMNFLANLSRSGKSPSNVDKSHVRGNGVATCDQEAGSGRGLVLVEVKTGKFYLQRKEIWIDLDSEDIAQRYTHMSKPKTAYGPQAIEEQPDANGVVGLRNLGNTCFMNSMLQCMSFTQPLTAYFLRGDYERALNRKNPLGTGGKLAEAYAKLIEEIWSNRFTVVAPVDFKQQLGRAFAQFSGYQQQDSHEFFSLLADGLHEDLNRIRKKPYTEPVEPEGRADEVVAAESWEVFKQRNDSIIVDNFMGLLRSHLTCPVCNFETVKFDAYSNWSVPIPRSSNSTINVVLYTMVPDSSGVYQPKLMRFLAEVPNNAGQKGVAVWLSEKTGIQVQDLITMELRNNKKSSLLHSNDDKERLSSYYSSLSKWGEDKDVVAYELETFDGANSANFAKRTKMCTEGDEKDSEDDEDARALKADETDEETVLELQFPFTRTSYSCFRMSDFVRIKGDFTRREIYQLIWSRVKFLLKDDYEVPQAFLNMIHGASSENKDGADAENKEEVEGSNDPFYICRERYRFEDPIPCDDKIWKHTSTLNVVFSEKAKESLRHETTEANSYSFRTMTLDERDKFLGIGEVEMDGAAAEKQRLQGSEETKNGIDLYECFDRFREREQLGENDEWFCPKCKELVKAFKQMDLWTAPEILVIHLKRFYYERNQYIRSWVDREKIGDLISFPMSDLDLKKYVRGLTPSDPSPIYDLYAVSNHMGGLGGGHYTAYVSQPEKESWFLMDDSRTSESAPERVVSANAYVLFYKRRS